MIEEYAELLQEKIYADLHQASLLLVVRDLCDQGHVVLVVLVLKLLKGCAQVVQVDVGVGDIQQVLVFLEAQVLEATFMILVAVAVILFAVVVTLGLVVELELFVIHCSVENAVVSDKLVVAVQACIVVASVKVLKCDAGGLFFDY